MKLLLDENLPRKLKADFDKTHQVFIVPEMGWNGITNGALLGLMLVNGFEALVTIDKNLQHQQNLTKFPLTIFVLDAPDNTLITLKPYIIALHLRLSQPLESQVVVISV